MEEVFGMPLNINTGDHTISPINTVTIIKGMDSDGDIVYALAMSEGMDIVDALALTQYAWIDVQERVKRVVTAE
jgi:hypothetical protein